MAGDGGPDGARSRVMYEFTGSKDKTLKLYEGLLHEIFNEPEHHGSCPTWPPGWRRAFRQVKVDRCHDCAATPFICSYLRRYLPVLASIQPFTCP